MSCSVLVVANATKVPEVIGDAGLLYKPRDLSDVADKVVMLLMNEGIREELFCKGKERIKLFTERK
ncbi:MAG: hypothetical protein QXF79_06870 [Ignisphaera sp.]